MTLKEERATKRVETGALNLKSNAKLMTSQKPKEARLQHQQRDVAVAQERLLLVKPMRSEDEKHEESAEKDEAGVVLDADIRLNSILRERRMEPKHVSSQQPVEHHQSVTRGERPSGDVQRVRRDAGLAGGNRVRRSWHRDSRFYHLAFGF